MGAYDEVKKQADGVIEKAKTTVGDLADKSGDKMADVVDKATDLIDDKTGGKASAATAMLDQTVAGAMDKVASATRKPQKPEQS